MLVDASSCKGTYRLGLVYIKLELLEVSTRFQSWQFAAHDCRLGHAWLSMFSFGQTSLCGVQDLFRSGQPCAHCLAEAKHAKFYIL